MNRVIHWIVTNKEWVFSGFGVTLIVLLIQVIQFPLFWLYIWLSERKYERRRAKEEKKSGISTTKKTELPKPSIHLATDEEIRSYDPTVKEIERRAAEEEEPRILQSVGCLPGCYVILLAIVVTIIIGIIKGFSKVALMCIGSIVLFVTLFVILMILSAVGGVIYRIIIAIRGRNDE